MGAVTTSNQRLRTLSLLALCALLMGMMPQNRGRNSGGRGGKNNPHRQEQMEAKKAAQKLKQQVQQQKQQAQQRTAANSRWAEKGRQRALARQTGNEKLKQTFIQQCGSCHAVPDPNYATDLAWIAQIQTTA